VRYLPGRIFGRLTLGLVAVSLAAIGVAAGFLYARFEAIDTRFREGTLQSFAHAIARDLRDAGRDGAGAATIAPATRRRLARAGGRFVVVGAGGDRLDGSPEVGDAYLPVGVTSERYFQLPGHGPADRLYGLSLAVPGVAPPVYVQVAFPNGEVVFDSVLQEFVKDIAWLWAPFLLLILATNIAVVRVALRPLAQAAEEAAAIQPGGVSVTLTERGLPDDLLTLVRAVNQAVGRLRDGYRTQEELIGDMTHELRTPLAVMTAQLAAIDTPHARMLERDVAAMARLVEQLFDRARLGRFRLEPGDVVDLRDVAREAAAFLAPRIVGRGRSIAVEAGDAAVTAAGGRDDLFRAVRNLIENALEHTPIGGLITVEVGADPPSIVVGDDGPGFPEAVLDPERRRNGRLRSDRRDGAGLGLAIVERTMQAHGGALLLANPPTGGGRAEMRFPPLAPSLAPSQAPSLAPPVPPTAAAS
jgi:signal transduction histidine kinase